MWTCFSLVVRWVYTVKPSLSGFSFMAIPWLLKIMITSTSLPIKFFSKFQRVFLHQISVQWFRVRYRMTMTKSSIEFQFSPVFAELERFECWDQLDDIGFAADFLIGRRRRTRRPSCSAAPACYRVFLYRVLRGQHSEGRRSPAARPRRHTKIDDVDDDDDDDGAPGIHRRRQYLRRVSFFLAPPPPGHPPIVFLSTFCFAAL